MIIFLYALITTSRKLYWTKLDRLKKYMDCIHTLILLVIVACRWPVGHGRSHGLAVDRTPARSRRGHHRGLRTGVQGMGWSHGNRTRCPGLSNLKGEAVRNVRRLFCSQRSLRLILTGSQIFIVLFCCHMPMIVKASRGTSRIAHSCRPPKIDILEFI